MNKESLEEMYTRVTLCEERSLTNEEKVLQMEKDSNIVEFRSKEIERAVENSNTSSKKAKVEVTAFKTKVDSEKIKQSQRIKDLEDSNAAL